MDVELANGRPRFVHPSKGQRQRAQLARESSLDIERDVIHGGHQVFHDDSELFLFLFFRFKEEMSEDTEF